MGHRGYLGSFILSKYSVDTTEKEEHYDYIINCIGKADLEFCEKYPEISYESNFNVLNSYIKKYKKSKIINFSSYYVYDDVGECSEDSRTTSVYKYCLHKLMSEKITSDAGGISFRIGKLFGHPDVNKQNKLTELLLKSTQITLDDVAFNPTSLQQVKRVIDFELENNNLNGVYNLSNKITTTHYEYGKFIQNNYNKYLQIKRIKKHKRDFHNYGRFAMSCDRIEKFISMSDWKIDIVEYLRSI